MKIRVGYELIYDFPQPTPMIVVLGTHFSRASDVVVPDFLTTSPPVPMTEAGSPSSASMAATRSPTTPALSPSPPTVFSM